MTVNQVQCFQSNDRPSLRYYYWQVLLYHIDHDQKVCVQSISDLISCHDDANDVDALELDSGGKHGPPPIDESQTRLGMATHPDFTWKRYGKGVLGRVSVTKRKASVAKETEQCGTQSWQTPRLK